MFLISPVPGRLAVRMLHILPDEIALLQSLHLLEELGPNKLFGQEMCQTLEGYLTTRQ